MSNSKKVMILVGPTAIGKTALSIEIAKKFNLEIISGDSMQVYRGMDIGTGKISEEEKSGITHHMIDVIEPESSFSVQEFQKHVTEIIDEIHEDDRIPFIVGGTGHYIRALIHGYEFDEEDDKEKRELTEMLGQLGSNVLHDRLKNIDPKVAGEIHPNNRQRVIRMLVKFELSDRISNRIGPGYTDDVKYDTFIVGLTRERKNIHANIEDRVDHMFEQGLPEEARHLFEHHSPSKTASAAIGYKEFIPYFEGSATLEDVKRQIKQNTRQYAKRQLTFFRNQLPVEWYDLDKVQKDIIMEDIYQFLHAKERENHGK
ncbi:tRNA (adenosine(37)-N6)-dimethylallyltransferase MiaA [Salinicoccus halodurans]|uniref:tRNA dimethylallyltransferase n=1 Tax=Salinicoccus halodurans TaxID=407035 RepID=A0A0F7HKV6_9STAP|nr:tRNA (adenosine(37)-N6)-dimethylallyltransferase MiaA [Salinicoccus halodurans]AKG73824.1 hypothetical protein AAT16_06045 [Salinicoccus halodurans]SFK56432.1 tRNA dimethylallyltransferase [Salinicoccus halodurans]